MKKKEKSDARRLLGLQDKINSMVKDTYKTMGMPGKSDKNAAVFIDKDSAAASEIKDISDGKKIRILIVEDDPSVLRFINASLKRLNGSIIMDKAQNGYEVFELLKNEDNIPDLVILDARMPLMDGVQVVKKIRKDALLKNIPILGISGLPNLLEDMISNGVDATLAKPFSVKEIQNSTSSIIPTHNMKDIKD